MIWNSGQPLSSSSLDSLPIRENFNFLKTGLDIHASSSANPHQVSLQQATDIGATTTNPIIVNASGSVITSLLIPINLQVGNDLFSKKIEHVVYAEHYASIQTAIDTLWASGTGGGIVVIPPGTTYITSTITLRPLVVVVGHGIEVSILKLASGSNCNMFEATSHYQHLRDLSLDGNHDNNTLGQGICCDNVYVGSDFQRLFVHEFAEEGMHFKNCSAFSVKDCWVTHNKKDQVLIEGGSESVNFYSVTAENGENYAGFHFLNTSPNALFGCHCEGCKYGVEIENSDSINVHNLWVDTWNTETSGSVTHSGIYIHGGSHDIIVQNVRRLGLFSSGYIIYDTDNNYYIDQSINPCSYYSDNQYYRTIQALTSGSVFKSLRVQNNELVGGNLEVKGNITADSSGSVLKSLRVQNNLLVGDDISLHGNNIYINKNGPDGNCYLFFYESNDPTGAAIEWSNNSAEFEFSHRVDVTGRIHVSDVILAHGDITINEDNTNADAILYFGKPTTGTEDLRWNKTTAQFEFSNKIKVATSGSVFSSLRVQNKLQVGGDLDIDGLNLRLNADGGSNETCEIYFGNGSEGLRWDSVNLRFVFSDRLVIDGYLLINGASPGISVSSIAARTLSLSNIGGGGFTLDVAGTLNVSNEGNLTVDGYVKALTSGSVLKSLRVQNNLLVGGSLETKGNTLVDGTIQALTSGSVLKALRVQNNELIGGTLEVKGNTKVDGNLTVIGKSGIRTIELRPELAALGDGTANNAAAQLALYTSVDAGNPKCRHWTLRFDATTSEYAYWQFRLLSDYISGGELIIQFYMESAQADNAKIVTWSTALQAVTPLDAINMLDLNLTGEGSGWNNYNYTLDYANPATAGRLCELTLSGLNMNSAVAGDFILVGLTRVSNTSVADASLITVQFRYNI